MRVLFLFLSVLSSCSALGQVKRFSFTRPKMGSPFQLIFFAPDSAVANRLADESFQLVDWYNDIFSDYSDSSELNLLCATAGKDSFVQVSDPLFEVFMISRQAWKKTNGNFDITIGTLSRVWRRARREKRFPDAIEIENARTKTGFEKIVFDTRSKRVKLLQAGMQLDLGGIAAGYIAQKIVDYLKSKGIASALANASGDIACSNAPPGKKGWTIAVNVPGEANELLDKTIELANKGVSTSGDVFQYTEHNGKRYSHIIDSKTGYGVTFQRNVTVIAADATTADWLATACSVLPLKKVKKLARKLKSELLITQMKGSGIETYCTQGINRYFGN